MEILNLEKYLNKWEFTSDDLVANFGFKKYGEKEIIIVDASPEQIKFGNGNFIGKFVFKNNNLLHVDLIPVIKDIKEPNYLSRKYEDIKMNYCKKVLESIYGDTFIKLSDGIQYKFNNYIIGCYKENFGKDKYIGGNIIIAFKEIK